MSVDTSAFQKSISRVLNDLQNRHDERATTIISTLYDKLVNDTPKDTGHAMASWNIVYDTPTTVSRENLATRRRASLSTKVARHNAIKTYQENLKSNILSIYKNKRDSLLYITNGARHIRLLEYEAQSLQAPKGWIRRSIAETRNDSLFESNKLRIDLVE